MLYIYWVDQFDFDSYYIDSVYYDSFLYIEPA